MLPVPILLSPSGTTFRSARYLRAYLTVRPSTSAADAYAAVSAPSCASSNGLVVITATPAVGGYS